MSVAKVRQCLSMKGIAAEDVCVMQGVIDLRYYWKPEKVKVLLLAESHVWTDAPCCLQPFKKPLPVTFSRNDYPETCIRFIYNLGYGEDELYPSPITAYRNTGTPQFWNIFSHISHSKNLVKKSGVSRNIITRLNNKIAILEGLRKRGIWLLDASLAAKKIPPGKYSDWISCSWCNHTAEVIKKEKPDHIIIIGRDVKRAITDIHCTGDRYIPYCGQAYSDCGGFLIEKGKLLDIDATVVNQPQARISKEQRNAELDCICKICAKVAP